MERKGKEGSKEERGAEYLLLLTLVCVVSLEYGHVFG